MEYRTLVRYTLYLKISLPTETAPDSLISKTKYRGARYKVYIAIYPKLARENRCDFFLKNNVKAHEVGMLAVNRLLLTETRSD